MAILLNKRNNNCLDNMMNDNRVVKIGVLNLMPNLEETEKDLIKVLDTPLLNIDLKFIYLNTQAQGSLKKDYMLKNYYSFSQIREKDFDGIIVTGAPLEHFLYEDIKFNEELKEFMEYTKIHTKTTIFLCFAAEFAIDYFYGITRYNLDYKLSGIYKNYIVNNTLLVKGMNEYFEVPVSRYCGINEEEILLNDNLILVSKGNDSGVFLVESKDSKQIFITGHLEYQKNTLEKEYLRDKLDGLNPIEPVNYYLDNKINYSWLSSGIILFHNWLYYYVC